jgi:uncharacterized phage protein gp47/JayE
VASTLDYTALDYTAIVAELAADAAAQPELAGIDLSPGSPDRRWIVAVATVGSKLVYYQNRWVNEAFLLHARLRQSVIDHAGGIGYTLASPSAAGVTVTITLPRAYADALTIPAESVVQTDDGETTYTTDSAVTFSPGVTTRAVSCTEGQAFTTTATGEASGTSPGGQRVALPSTSSSSAKPFVGNSEVVRVSGVAWTRVANFLSSSSASNHYRVEIDGDDAATVVFGDGTNGRRPPVSAPIVITYRTCSGVAGRVRRGRITRILGSFYTVGGTPVDPTVRNTADSSGGEDRERIEHARYAAVNALRATERTVALEDYELHAMEVAGVARALAHNKAKDAGLPYNYVRVYLVPSNGGTANAGLRGDVETYVTVTKPNTAGVLVEASSTTYVPHTVTATLTVRAGTDTATLEADAQAAVANLFSPAAMDDDGNHHARFGHPIPRAAIIAALKALPGVTNVTLVSPASDATLGTAQFPSLAATASITIVAES